MSAQRTRFAWAGAMLFSAAKEYAQRFAAASGLRTCHTTSRLPKPVRTWSRAHGVSREKRPLGAQRTFRVIKDKLSAFSRSIRRFGTKKANPSTTGISYYIKLACDSHGCRWFFVHRLGARRAESAPKKRALCREARRCPVPRCATARCVSRGAIEIFPARYSQGAGGLGVG